MSLVRSALLVALSLTACAHPQVAAPIQPPPVAPPVVHAVQGTVVGPDGGAVGGAVVALNSIDPASERAQSGDAEGLFTTGADGAFWFDGVAAGPYAVTVGTEQYAEAMSAPLTVAAGATARAEVRLSEGGVLLELRVVGEADAPLGADIQLSRVSDSMGDTFHPVRRADGASVVRLHPGRYQAVIAREGYEKTGFDLRLNGPTTRVVSLHERADDAAAAAPEVVDWLKAHAIALTTAEAGHGLDDLRPLLALVGKARVVNLGEATHGTREFFQLKHRLLELLVTEAGFNTFAIEASWPECLALNDYVQGGKGDPAQLTARMRFWTWDTAEVVALVEWMRAWNAVPAHQRKLSFLGFDMQYAPVAGQQVTAYLAKVDPAFLAKHRAALNALGSEFRDSLALQGQGWSQALRDEAAAVRDAFEAHREAWVKHSSARDFALARHSAQVLVQAVTPDDGVGAFRDAAMAENLEWILATFPDAKVVGWAHNQHVSYRNPESMGSVLKRALGADLVTLTFAFGSGEFQAIDLSPAKRGLMVHHVEPFEGGALDATLLRTGLALAVFDWRALPADGPVAAYFAHRHASRTVGAAFFADWAANFVMSAKPADAEGLIFVAKTTSARPNRTGHRAGRPNASALTNLDFSGGVEPWLATEDRLRGYSARVHSQCGRGISTCLELTRSAPSVIPGLGAVSQRVVAKAYLGKHLRVSLWAKGAQAHVFAVAAQSFGAGSTVAEAAVSPSGGQVQLELDVDPMAETLTLGVAHEGATGEVLMGPVTVEVTDPPGASPPPPKGP